MNTQQINKRASLLQKHLCDEQKELQALFALQALMVHMEQPASECALLNRLDWGGQMSPDPSCQRGRRSVGDGVGQKVRRCFGCGREGGQQSTAEEPLAAPPGVQLRSTGGLNLR